MPLPQQFGWKVVDSEARHVGNVVFIETDRAGARKEIVVELTPKACEALLGPGTEKGVWSVPADLAVESKDGFRLLKNMVELRKLRANAYDP